MRHGCSPKLSTRIRVPAFLGCVALLTASVAAGCARVGTAPASGRVAGVPASIAGDCSADVTVGLQAWIDATPDGSTLVFTPGACYRIDGTLRMFDRNALTFEGRGATFRPGTDGRELPPSWARTRSQFSFIGGSNITVRNVVVRGANPAAGLGDAAYVAELEAQHAFVIGQVQGMLIERVQTYDVYGDFVYVGPGTRRLTVRDSTFARNGRQGWTVMGGEDIVFDHNSISDTRRATIDMEPLDPGALARRITFSNNEVGVGRLFFFANQGVAAPTEDISIIGNHLHGKSLTINVQPTSGIRSRYRVIGNTSDDERSQSGGGVMWFQHVVGVEVRGNVQPTQPDRGISGVAVSASADVTVTGNEFRNAVAPVLSLDASTNVHQSRNSIGWPLAVAPAS